MTTSRRLAPLPLLLIGLAVFAVLANVPGTVEAQTPANQSATGRPVVFPSAEGAGILLADTSGVDDPNGLRFVDPEDPSNVGYDDWSYQWVRVDGATAAETGVGVDSARYQRVEADVGSLIKVRVSFVDQDGFEESVTSLPFGPIAEPAPSLPSSTLVSNTGQSASASATITQQYALGFHLGAHGQGYELSSVSIELAAVPSSLTVSLWIGGQAGSGTANKVFDFVNPSSFAVGLNEFTAPAGAFAYQNVRYWIVLSGFGSSLSIKETTSDGEDAGGETGAELGDNASLRASGSTGPWVTSTSRGSVLRLALEGSRRASGILASNYAQTGDEVELVSLGDKVGIPIALGAADRYLIRGFSWYADDSTPIGPPIYNPFDLRTGSTTSPLGAKLFSLTPTRYEAGINVWTAPQGATVAGSGSYLIYEQYDTRPHGTTLTRVYNTTSDDDDPPTAPGVTLSDAVGDFDGRPLMAFLGEPLDAMAQNLGQTNASHVSVGGATNKVLTQGFTTGPNELGYRLQGIGVNIEGSSSSFPDDSASVSVAVHADSSGQPGAKLFDLVSPTEYAAGHSFFEAPPGTNLAPNSSYVLVWRHLGGTWHRLQRTSSDSEDTGALTGFSIANVFYRGADLDSLSADSGSHALEIAVYGRFNQSATGRPVVFPSAEGAGILLADTSGVDDPNGLRFVDPEDPSNVGYDDWSYQWVRVDGATAAETGVGVDSARYQRVEADVGSLIKVRVSFVDQDGFEESVTSLPFGPIAEPAPSLPSSTLVSNTGQSASASATITQQYALGFHLGAHGQGYELSSVSIELAAVPSSLTVSLWIGGQAGSGTANKVFDFVNPSSFAVGLNEFTAPAGAFAYQNVRYWIVLSGFGSSLSIKETTSDGEDAGGETGAELGDNASLRASGSTGPWVTSTSRGSVLRLALEGSRRASGILASNYAQTGDEVELVSLGDKVGIPIALGAADRYLIRGFSWYADDSTPIGPPIYNPFDLRTGSTTSPLGAKLFSLTPTRYEAGINVWTAPQGATVAGSGSYLIYEQYDTRPHGTTLTRVYNTTSDDDDPPTAPGVTLSDAVGDFDGRPLMAFLGEPLDAMAQNLGQTNASHVSVGGATNKVLTQGFTTGPNELGYRLQGIGVNIEGSSSSFPDDSASVSVAVHADSSGQPGAKLFDLVSPTEYAAGHSFFEAPPGTNLAPNSSYVLVWRHLGGTWHRLQRTSSDSEDTGALTGFSIANVFYRGADLDSLSADSGSHALEIAVYGEANDKAPFVPGGHPVTRSWLHIPEDVDVGYQFRVLFVTHRGRLPTSGDIEEYNAWVHWEAEQKYNDPTIRAVASEFKAVVCTAAVDARTNTGMANTIGVPIHWLDGGWQDRPTLVANSNAEFYGDEWVNSDWGAYVTGNSAHFHENAKIWTGCDSKGVAHPSVPMGAISAMDMVAVGTPRDSAANNAPIGAVDVDSGYAYYKFFVVIDGEKEERLLPLYAISPIFTVVAEPEGD